MERNIEKRRRAKYSAIEQRPISTSVKHRDDAENGKTVKNPCAHRRTNEIDPSNDRKERRQLKPANDHNNNYYFPTNVQKPSRRDGVSSSSRIKFASPQNRDDPHGYDDKNRMPRLSRNEFLQHYVNSAKYGENIAVVRKSNFNGTNGETGELENSTFNENDSLAEDANEEVEGDEEHQEYGAEINEKDSGEHEIDDEIDEDVFERHLDRTRLRRHARIESSPRGQKIFAAPVSSSYTRAAKINTRKTSQRCHSAADRRIPEIPTEEETDDEEPEIREAISYSPQKISWKSRSREEDPWIPGRKSIERYSDPPGRPQLSSSRHARRPKTRPEMEKPTKSISQYESISNMKCDHCGRPSGQTPKTTSSRNASYRLQDSRYFMGGTKGEEDFFEDQTNGAMLTCRTKPRRSKGSRSPIFESGEKGLTNDDKDEYRGIDKSRHGKNSRETVNPRRSSAREDDRRVEQSRNNKNYCTAR